MSDNVWYDPVPNLGSYDPPAPGWASEQTESLDPPPDDETVRAWDEGLPPPPLLANLDGERQG